MKIQVQEVEGEGLLSFLGKPIVLFCMNYIYAGKLVGVNDTCVKLEDAKIVYETGTLNAASYTNVNAVYGSGVYYIQNGAIESFGPGK